MSPKIRRRYEAYLSAPITWDPVRGGRKSWAFREEVVVEDVGPDSDGERFAKIGRRMLTGLYYPPDVMDAFGLWDDESREMRIGDRILQRARLLPFSRWPVLWAMTEVFIAEMTESTCILGYVTTRRHFGRGLWKSTLRREQGRLSLTVESTSGPGSWLFWLGLPFARLLQRRAWSRAAEKFSKV
jgi:hypothetical protein